MSAEDERLDAPNAPSTQDALLLNLKIHTAAKLCTEAHFQYLQRHFGIFDFFLFSLELATTRDSFALATAKALAALSGSEEDKAHFLEISDNKDLAFQKLKGFAALQSENMCIRSVDNLLSYLSETIQACMRSRPEMLRSNETIRLEDVLRFNDYKSLIEFIVERKINELSYGGITEINNFLVDRTGISLWQSDEERSLLSVSIELRNNYTHNRGIINQILLRKIKGATHPFDFVVGKRFSANFDELVLLANNMFTISTRLDAKTANKYGLQTKQYQEWDSIIQ